MPHNAPKVSLDICLFKLSRKSEMRGQNLSPAGRLLIVTFDVSRHIFFDVSHIFNTSSNASVI